mmetsp:Transcript_39421/g.92691  ORF Transcript_39421/g.92691 Transcript_39421/m.92691 type:complete len:180 (+) Transcript_39421:359-898(+)
MREAGLAGDDAGLVTVTLTLLRLLGRAGRPTVALRRGTGAADSLAAGFSGGAATAPVVPPGAADVRLALALGSGCPVATALAMREHCATRLVTDTTGARAPSGRMGMIAAAAAAATIIELPPRPSAPSDSVRARRVRSNEREHKLLVLAASSSLVISARCLASAQKGQAAWCSATSSMV